MGRRYPCLGGFTLIPARKNKKCQICGEKAAFLATVEFDWFRGNDGVYKLCKMHKDQMKSNFYKMLDLLPPE